VRRPRVRARGFGRLRARRWLRVSKSGSRVDYESGLNALMTAGETFPQQFRELFNPRHPDISYDQLGSLAKKPAAFKTVRVNELWRAPRFIATIEIKSRRIRGPN